jgi:hypothetical protein
MLMAATQIGETMPACSGNPARRTLLSFPKRKLSPLRRACLSLGLTVDARPNTNLARLLRRAGSVLFGRLRVAQQLWILE